VLIEVRDSGIGIPPEYQEKVFDEFFQVDNPGRERSQGLGLGLSIVKRLADLMGIRLELQSARGRGTVFRLRCRQAQPAADENALASAPAAPGPGDGKLLRGRRVLVVDNEADIVRGITNVLEGAGASVSSALSASQALACIDARNRFDVAILDYRLGGAITGIELASSLQHRQPGLPTLILTGDTHAAEIQALRQSHIPVLFKPVRPAELLQLTLQAAEARPRAEEGATNLAAAVGPGA
jgi:CheY-like chemotaxis protein